MSMVPTFVTASFISGILMAVGITHHQTEAQIQKAKQQQVAQLIAQNRQLCKQIKSHHLKPPRGVKC